ncbi:Protein tilB-like protein, partial [Nibea albiflora]
VCVHRLDFSLTEDEDNNTIVLDLSVYRHMDTSLIDVDVQPTYARVGVKGKIFQIVLPAEVKPDSSTAQRSQTTDTWSSPCPGNKNVPERLEVDPSKHTTIDLANIVPRQRSSAEGPLETSRVDPPATTGHSRTSEEFVDDPDVPPLI